MISAIIHVFCKTCERVNCNNYTHSVSGHPVPINLRASDRVCSTCTHIGCVTLNGIYVPAITLFYDSDVIPGSVCSPVKENDVTGLCFLWRYISTDLTDSLGSKPAVVPAISAVVDYPAHKSGAVKASRTTTRTSFLHGFLSAERQPVRLHRCQRLCCSCRMDSI